METVQDSNVGVQSRNVGAGPARMAGWFALAVFAGWILAFAGITVVSSAFPGTTDAYNPAKIQANVLLASLNWFVQISLGTVLVALALPFSDYLAIPMNLLVRFALIGGLLGYDYFDQLKYIMK